MNMNTQAATPCKNVLAYVAQCNSAGKRQARSYGLSWSLVVPQHCDSSSMCSVSRSGLLWPLKFYRLRGMGEPRRGVVLLLVEPAALHRLLQPIFLVSSSARHSTKPFIVGKTTTRLC